jgi:hypothetical protein
MQLRRLGSGGRQLLNLKLLAAPELALYGPMCFGVLRSPAPLGLAVCLLPLLPALLRFLVTSPCRELGVMVPTAHVLSIAGSLSVTLICLQLRNVNDLDLNRLRNERNLRRRMRCLRRSLLIERRVAPPTVTLGWAVGCLRLGWPRRSAAITNGQAISSSFNCHRSTVIIAIIGKLL